MKTNRSVRVSNAFPTLGIVACSGHLIDTLVEVEGFPGSGTNCTGQNRGETGFLGATCGYSSAACGTDIIFLEAMSERGGETHIFLPFSKEEFVHTSVARGGA